MPDGPTAPAAARRAAAQGPAAIAWRRFRRQPRALVGLAVIAALAGLAVFAPWIARHDPYATDLLRAEQPPSAAHWLGTDDLGRDVFARLLFGGRISLSVGLVSVAIAATLGTLLGATAGYYGGAVDNAVMRLADVVLSFPALVIAITAVAVFGGGIHKVMMVIGLLTWPAPARQVRGELLSLREREFVQAAQAMGLPNRRIIFRHALPNAMGPLIVSSTIGVANAILQEAALSFLGLGVPLPQASWGNMLSSALSLRVLQFQWWLWLPPGALIFLAVLSIHLLGDGLRDALDPRLPA